MEQEKITLNQQRDFGALLGDSIQYTIQHYRPILQLLLLYVVPIFLIQSAISIYYYGSPMDLYKEIFQIYTSDPTNSSAIMDALNNYGADAPGWVGMANMGLGLLSIVAYMVFFAIVNRHIYIYIHQPEDSENVQAIQDGAFPFIFRYLGLTVLVIIGAIIGGLAGGLLAGIATMIFPAIGLIVLLALLGLSIYYWITVSLMYAVSMNEDLPLIDTILHCFKLIKGHFFQTFGLFIVFFIATIVLSWIVTSILKIADPTTNHFIAEALGSGISVLLGTFSSVAMVFQYFNLSFQKGTDHMDEYIDEIGH